MKEYGIADLLIVPFCFGITMLIAKFAETDDAFGGKWFLVFFAISMFLAYPHFAKGRNFFWGGTVTLMKWLLICLLVFALGIILLFV